MNKWIWYGLGAIATIIVARVVYKEYLINQILQQGEPNVDRAYLKEFKISELRAVLNDYKISGN
jgi:hypothetical protein